MTTIDILRREDLVLQLEAHGSVIKGSSCTCPWHEDSNPSAGILHGNDGRWRINCLVCKRHGDAIDLAASAAGIDRKEWFKRNGDQARKSAPVAHPPEKQPIRWDGIQALAEQQAKWAQGTVERIFEYAMPDMERPRLVVIRIAITNKHGQPDKTFRQAHHDGTGWIALSPAKPWPLYALPDVLAAQSVVIVEGEKAAEALRVLGITATTTPCGYANPSSADLSPLSGKDVVIWPDNDEPGAKYGHEVIELLGHLPTPPASIRVVNVASLKLPPKGDAVDFIDGIPGDSDSRHSTVLEVLRSAPVVGDSGDLAQLIEDEISGRHSLVSWPWPYLTQASRSLVPGAVTVIAGAPGAGKSWAVRQCLLDWQRQGIRVAALELEETKAWHLKHAMAYLDGSGDLLKSEWCARHPDAVRSAHQRHKDVLAALGRSLWCEGNITSERAAEWVEERCKAGCRVIVVDPITLADPGSAKSWDADRQFMNRSKVAIEKAGASLVLITHPRKAFGPTAKAFKPTMDDLAGGASYQRAAASVLWLENLPTEKRELVATITNDHRNVAVHRMITVLKARNTTGVGSVIGFSVQRLAFHEEGRLVTGDQT